MDLVDFDRAIVKLAKGRKCAIGVDIDRTEPGHLKITFTAYIQPKWFKASRPEDVIRQITGANEFDLRSIGVVPRS